MPDVEGLLIKARFLGEALAAHPTVKAYYEAQKTAHDDEGAQQLLRDYHTHTDRIRRLEAENKPVEIADKHQLKDLETQMAGRDSLKMLVRWQADYVTLMNQVNRAIDQPLHNLVQPEKPRE